jgi:hypothetical protein
MLTAIINRLTYIFLFHKNIPMKNKPNITKEKNRTRKTLAIFQISLPFSFFKSHHTALIGVIII